MRQKDEESKATNSSQRQDQKRMGRPSESQTSALVSVIPRKHKDSLIVKQPIKK